jgi:uncharacterized protein YfaS (alpha-2-macroglobulin family)
MKLTGFSSAFLGLVFVLASCSPPVPQTAPRAEEVVAHTGGLVSRFDPVRVVFASDRSDAERSSLVAHGALSLEPAVSGRWEWEDNRTVVFRPEAPLGPGASFLVRFRPTDSSLHAFEFGFRTLVQRLGLNLDPLSCVKDPDTMELSGTVSTVDRTDVAQLERTVQVSLAGQGQSVQWTHDADGFTHRFVVSHLAKGDKALPLAVEWSGSAIGAPDHGKTALELPAAGTFALLSARAASDGHRQIDLTFSEPVKRTQDLQGLVTVGASEGLQFSIRDNKVSVYSPVAWQGPQDVVVGAGVVSISGRPIQRVASERVVFTHPLPSVKFLGTGAILPSTEAQTIPIETTNVDTVLVEALQVFDDNALQFFQVNTHTDQRQLNRVGRVIWRQVVPLDFRPDDEDKPVRRGLDLSPLLKKNPKGFLVIKVSIRRQHLRLEGHVGATEFRDDPVNWDPAFTPEDRYGSYWDYYEDQDSNDVYEQRDNPLSTSYYLPRWDHPVQAWRNVMISDLGLLAKKGEDGAVTVAVSDLRTAQPRSGVTLAVYDFQRQLLWKGVSDAQGQATAKLDPNGPEPTFVTGTADNQMGYLKLDAALRLSVSSFDVGGDKLDKGINGFVYGERGVWRPGDPMYLTFILEDPAKTLPLNYPVVFELRNPAGELADKQVKTLGVNGMYTFPTRTLSDAPTGQWMARVTVAGKVFEKDLKVEMVMPNRLKIDLQWKGAEQGLGSGTWDGLLSSRWLHGAVAANLKAETKVSFSPIPTSFGRWGEYVFDDPAKRFAPHTDKVFEGELDPRGNVALTAAFSAQDSSPGRLQATFYTKVFEPSGAFSSSAKTFDFDPYTQYVGLLLPKGDAARGMLLTDTDHVAKVVLVDRKGAPVSSGSVKMSLVKLKWLWWWEKGDDHLPEYISEEQYQTISSGTIDVKNGVGEWKFRLAYPEWGRFMVRAEDSAGHSTGKVVYIDWPGWAGRSSGDGSGSANLLTLTTDKTKYKVGETVSVTFPSQSQGRAWVTLEAAGKVLRSEWAPPSSGATTVYQFPATGEMAPNIYVHVTFVQPHQQTRNDLPIRLYGVVPVMVEDPDSRVQPVIVSDSVFQPSSKAKIVVREASGKPMTYTLAIVDEGLLGITSYVTPDPWKTFYRRRASLLQSWDIYNWVSGAWTGSLQNILTVGGDGDLGDNSKVKVNRFPPMVRFLEPSVLGAGESKTHVIDIPAYVGEVRIMAVAAYKRTYGSAERSVTVKSPVMALPTLPRVLSPGETFAMPVSVFAYDGQADVKVNVAVEGAVALTASGDRTVAMKGGTEALTTFPLATSEGIGPARVSVTVTSGDFSSTQVVDLEVRMPSAPLTREAVGPLLKAGESWTTPVKAFGYPGTGKAVLEVSQLRPLALERRLAYLIQYPHGCIEQTTSAVFPQVFLDKVVALDDERKKQVQTNVTAGLQRLKSFQTLSGGFSYWPGEANPHLWGTNYAGHFLVEAKRAGYALPPDLYSRWLAFEKQAAASWSEAPQDSVLDQAYRLYVLAAANAADLGAMNRLKERLLSAPALHLLAAAYQGAGQSDMATQLILKVASAPATDKADDETFGSDVRNQALELAALVDLKDGPRAAVLFDQVGQALAKDQWMSTQTTAWALSACARFLGWQAVGKDAQVKVAWGTSAPAAVTFPQSVWTQGRQLLASTNETVTVTNVGPGAVAPRLALTANPKPGEESPGTSGLALTVNYDADAGTFDRLASGTPVQATVQVRNTSRWDQSRLALSYLAPSGWELLNPRLSQETTDPGAEYQDYRDDRLLTYFSLKSGETKTFVVKAIATYQGRFYLPMVQVEAMYDGTVYARVPGSWVTVLPPGSP